MVIYTERGNFDSFESLLRDMQLEGYNSVRILKTTHVCGQITLGGGKMSMEDVKNMIAEIHKDIT